MNESCHTNDWVVSHMGIVISRIRMSHVTLTNESCHTYDWVVSHMGISHITYVNESCHTYEWVMSHIWLSRVTYRNKSYHVYEWVMSHLWMSHVTQMIESCHIYTSYNVYERPRKNAFFARFSDEIRPTCSKIPWNFPAVQIIKYQFYLSLEIKLSQSSFFESIYHLTGLTNLFEPWM